MTDEEYSKLPLENRLTYAARTAKAPYHVCALLDEAREEIERLREYEWMYKGLCK